MQDLVGGRKVETTEVQLARRAELPGDSEQGAHRLFHADPRLKKLLPDPSQVGFGWIKLEAGQSVPARTSDQNGMLVVVAGTAKLTGKLSRTVTQDSIVAIPAGCEYGLADVGPQGFEAITVQFPQSAARSQTAETGAAAVMSLDDLLAHNEKRLAQAQENPFFSVIRTGSLDDPESRQTYVNCIQVFSDVFQKIILGRQATCRDPSYEPVFLAHMIDELGHNELLASGREVKPVRDPILRATADWFAYQMFVLDNAEKAALVHLVLETAGHRFHTLAQDAFSGDVGAEYYRAHADSDEEHTDMGVEPLRDLHPRTYQRLAQIVDDGWDMFNTMSTRIVELATARTATSTESLAG